MTGPSSRFRGKDPRGPRPVTPPDPTLTSRPVPRTRVFPLETYGAGASPDILTSVKPLEVLQAEPESAESRNPFMDSIFHLLKEVTHWETVSQREDGYSVRDVTWGFYVSVTSYSDTALEKLPQALHNWVKVTERGCIRGTARPYREEAIKRFKLDVIKDEEALQGASDDRVREEFRAQIRGLQLTDDDYPRLPPPARNTHCFVLDEASIAMLADLEFPEDPEDDYGAFGGKNIKFIDGNWERPKESHSFSTYRGVGYVAITGLAWVYTLLSSGDFMEDWHPLNGTP
ncbi:hypothetical protein B0T10DRAFT_518379 [Thelonectria olida]|uniref:Uncharacterized protein n=1 Tax=Thelonectria olida TaxID=1576542 RepID=A0A9P8VZ00_9HYPO|nr:hypothetical protein B0T10DRAFT_518379 [Thelonectria olida]